MTARWVLAGGGTGGHVTPALALAETARAAGEEVLFIGARRGLERRLVPEAGFELVALGARPVVGRGPFARLAALGALALATLGAWRALGRFRPSLVLSVGGYASVPAVLAAWVRRLPIALLEANARPGAANRLAARFARLVFVEFEAAGQALAGHQGPGRVLRTGLPLRPALVEALATAPPPRTPEPPLRVFVCGGSQGARQINEAVMEALPQLDPGRFTFVHQTGDADRDRVALTYRGAKIEATVLAFETEMAARYRWADLIVGRSGAFTLAELALAGRPAILIPLVHTGGGDQLANARERERAGAAQLLEPGGDLAGRLVAALEALAADPARVLAMGAAARTLGRPDAAAAILGACRRVVGEAA